MLAAMPVAVQASPWPPSWSPSSPTTTGLGADPPGADRAVRRGGRSAAGVDGRHPHHRAPHRGVGRGRGRGPRPGRRHGARYPRRRACRAAPISTRSPRSPLHEIRIASRTPEHAAALAARHPAARRRRLVRGGGDRRRRGVLLYGCARAGPLGGWLAPGTHVSSVAAPSVRNSTRPRSRAGRVFAEWRGAVDNFPPAGAHELQGLDPDRSPSSARSSPASARVGARPMRPPSTSRPGTAVDAAAARLVSQRARAAGAGTVITI